MGSSTFLAHYGRQNADFVIPGTWAREWFNEPGLLGGKDQWFIRRMSSFAIAPKGTLSFRKLVHVDRMKLKKAKTKIIINKMLKVGTGGKKITQNKVSVNGLVYVLMHAFILSYFSGLW